MREKLIKWKLSGCTVAVTPITVIDTREHIVRALDFPGSVPAPAPPAPAPAAEAPAPASAARRRRHRSGLSIVSTRLIVAGFSVAPISRRRVPSSYPTHVLALVNAPTPELGTSGNGARIITAEIHLNCERLETAPPTRAPPCSGRHRVSGASELGLPRRSG